MTPDEAQRWISDAREHGFPVVVTGVVLFHGVLGLPPWATVVLLALLLFPLMVLGAARALTDADWPHG